MRIRTAAALAAAVLPFSSPAPAGATEVELGAAGSISVAADMGACATVSFPKPTTFAGVFTASGALAGPGTIVGVVRGATPIVVVNGTSWSGCLPDAYAGATTGAAVYTLTATGTSGDYTTVVVCVIAKGLTHCA